MADPRVIPETGQNLEVPKSTTGIKTKYTHLLLYTNILIKKVLHHSLLFLCIWNFQIVWNQEKLSERAKGFRHIFSVLFILIPVKDR